MTYREALAYLASLEPLGIRPGLDRIRALLARLGDPQGGFRSVLIAGTNGKGSVAAFLSAILRQAGLGPGVYTSPHLVRFEERIVVGEEGIAEKEVAALVFEVKGAIEGRKGRGLEQPTYFEATTALAFLHFRRRGVPLAVLEVGMGGRFDATNVVSPLACAITPIALDHTQWLGGTLEAIAFQKAGILRRGVPAVIARQDPAALEAIQAEAERVGALLTPTSACETRPLRDPGPGLEDGGSVPAGGGGPFTDPPVFSLATPSGRRYPKLRLALRGGHQVENATVAILLAEHLHAAGLGSIDERAIARGLAGAVWPGRLEIVPGNPDLLLDGAHNPAGCETLATYLRDHQARRRAVLIFASLSDKPADRMLRILCPLMAKVIVTRVPVARGESAGTLLRSAAMHHADAVRAGTIEEALALARRAAGSGGLVVVSGSLYLVGEIKKIVPPAA